MHLNILGSDGLIGCTLIRQGVMPSAPGRPSVAITIQTLELYRLAHFRCPQLSISAFVKALSDIHSVCCITLNNSEPCLLLLRFSSNSKNIEPVSSPSHSTSTSPSAQKLTVASSNQLAASPVTGAFVMPVQLARTS